jgi:hypothetical protein
VIAAVDAKRVMRANQRTMRPVKQSMRARSKRESVRQIEHSSIDHAFFSCDQIRLRVKSDLKFGCSISLINKRRSITELNSDSRPQHFIVKTNRRLASRTLRFCGVAPSQEIASVAEKSETSKRAQRVSRLPRNAGFAPAFPHLPSIVRLACGLRRAFSNQLRSSTAGAVPTPACGLASRAARGTEFISVSGLCPERSALHSDLRLKRFSGSAAAPELPHAPMNSPAAFRAGFPSHSLIH